MDTTGFGSFACEAHVSALHAIARGVPEGGCIEIGPGTILSAVLVFGAVVMGLQWIVRRLLAGLRHERAPAHEDGPVRSARRHDLSGGPIDSR